MTQLCPKVPDICRRVIFIRRYCRVLWDRVCLVNAAVGKPSRYKQLPRRANSSVSSKATSLPAIKQNHQLPASGGGGGGGRTPASPLVMFPDHFDSKDSDLVAMKISILGDPQIGKTSFLTKYVGTDEKELQANKDDQMGGGLHYVDKIQCVQGARLFYSIWEVGGDLYGQDHHIPAACKDSVAILFMFDLTSRCTLNSIISWYQEARKWNQTAIPILIGTKFDDFVQLPMDLQWTIASQARACAKAINATLFFSSSTYNINVNKVFKFITAKLFNLPWSVERNLTIGEPIIDF